MEISHTLYPQSRSYIHRGKGKDLGIWRAKTAPQPPDQKDEGNEPYGSLRVWETRGATKGPAGVMVMDHSRKQESPEDKGLSSPKQPIPPGQSNGT